MYPAAMMRLTFLAVLLWATAAAADVASDSLRVVQETAGLESEEQLSRLLDEVTKAMPRNPRLSLALARRSLALAEELDDLEKRFLARSRIGISLYYLGDYGAALRQYEVALGLARELGDRVLEGNALNNIGILHFVWGDHDLALRYYLDDLAIQLEMDNPSGAARCYNNIAGVEQTAGNYPAALEDYHRALDIYRALGEAALEASTLNNIGLVQYEMDDFDPALENLEAALAIEQAIGDRAGEALSLNNMGRIRADQGRHADARDLLERALAIRRGIGDPQGESVSLQLLGTLLVEEGRAAEAIPLLEKALALAQELEVTELVSDDLLALSDAHAALGQYETALGYYRRHKAARDRILNEEKARTMAAAKMKFEADLKDQEISSLRREAEFEGFRRRILLVGAGLLLLIIALLFNRYRFQKKSNEAIRATNEDLARVHAELEKAAREELAHVSRVVTMGELAAAFAHELNQPLAAIMANARAGRNLLAGSGGGEPEVGEALADIRDDAERATEIIRRLRDMMRKGEERRETHDLNTVVESAVRFVAGAAERQGLLIVRRLAPGLPPVSCDNIQLQQVVVNLLQNALTAMDGRKGDIVVRTLHADEGGVAVEVEDRGPGAPPEVLAEMFEPFFTTKRDGLGMGLAICRTILRAHGSELAVARNDDAGLSFSFRLDPA